VLSTSTEDPVAISARTEKIANVLIGAGTHLLDESSDEEPPRGKKVAHSPASDYSSDDEPLEKPKRA